MQYSNIWSDHVNMRRSFIYTVDAWSGFCAGFIRLLVTDIDMDIWGIKQV